MTVDQVLLCHRNTLGLSAAGGAYSICWVYLRYIHRSHSVGEPLTLENDGASCALRDLTTSRSCKDLDYSHRQLYL